MATYGYVVASDVPGAYGWGNGYVVVPKTHKWYGKHYDDVEPETEVPGGLTHSSAKDDGWCLGFDTMRPYNKGYTKAAVQNITADLVAEIQGFSADVTKIQDKTDYEQRDKRVRAKQRIDALWPGFFL